MSLFSIDVISNLTVEAPGHERTPVDVEMATPVVPAQGQGQGQGQGQDQGPRSRSRSRSKSR